MKNRLIAITIVLAAFGCETKKTPDEVFQAAKEKLFAAEQISITQTMLWEDPNLGDIDTFLYDVTLQKYPNRYFEYNYIGKRKGYELSYLNDVLLSVNHSDSSVIFHTEENPEMYEYTAASNSFLSFSPINLMKKDPWVFKKDTAIQDKKLLDFYWVEMDTLISDKNVYLENHLFINPSNLIVVFASRRLYHNGKQSQIIDSWFTDFEIGPSTAPLQSDFPKGYLTKTSAQERENIPKVLTVGTKAPDFELQDLDGRSVRLSDFKGKKVLLDFSIINCGWCKIALDEFRKPDFEFPSDIIPLYINPVDSKEKMDKYHAKVKIPFAAMINAKSTGEAYGVSGYPTFYIIDKAGYIEEVLVGYDDDFIAKLKK